MVDEAKHRAEVGLAVGGGAALVALAVALFVRRRRRRRAELDGRLLLGALRQAHEQGEELRAALRKALPEMGAAVRRALPDEVPEPIERLAARIAS
ncbi:MAG: hypothetical protein KGJ77_01735 [Acidobacteriota bacterium]|nr:hypothetical protein [Acidobacteriota bacterium]